MSLCWHTDLALILKKHTLESVIAVMQSSISHRTAASPPHDSAALARSPAAPLQAPGSPERRAEASLAVALGGGHTESELPSRLSLSKGDTLNLPRSRPCLLHLHLFGDASPGPRRSSVNLVWMNSHAGSAPRLGSWLKRRLLHRTGLSAGQCSPAPRPAGRPVASCAHAFLAAWPPSSWLSCWFCPRRTCALGTGAWRSWSWLCFMPTPGT